MIPAVSEASAPFRLPTLGCAANLLLQTGESLRGQLFLGHGARHPGPELPEERLNDADAFVPFLPAGAPAVLLVAKQHIVCVALERAAIGAVEDATGTRLPPFREALVAVECQGRRLDGWIRLDGPVDRTRVIDVLNRPERFLRLADDARIYLVNRLHVAKVMEGTPQ